MAGKSLAKFMRATSALKFDQLKGHAESLMNEITPVNQTLPLSQNPAAVYLSRLSTEKSRRTMFGSLKTIVGVMTDAPPDDITFESVMAFQWHEMTYQWTTVAMSRIANLGLAPSTANRHIYALRGVLKECWRLGLMSQEDYARAVDLKPIIGSRLPKGRSLEAWEIRALLNDCLQRKPKPSHIRDAAMIAVLYTNGLRRAEMVNINLEDFNAETGCISFAAAVPKRVPFGAQRLK